MSDDIFDFINSNTSQKNPSFKFTNVGDKLVGTIVRRAMVDTKDLNSGEKVRNLVLEVTNDADGVVYALWIKPSQLLTALGRALADVNAVKGSPYEGDRIGVEFTGTEPPKQAGLSPKKIYRVHFKQGDANRPAETNSVEDLLG